MRKSRSARAPLEAMLMPGDTVLVDSLEQGWYRVALEGEVHRARPIAGRLEALGAGHGTVTRARESRSGTSSGY